MGFLKKAAVCTGVLAAAGIGETAYFYNFAMKRNDLDRERTMKMSGTDWSKYMPFIEKRSWKKHKLESRLLVEISITSDMQTPPYLDESERGE